MVSPTDPAAVARLAQDIITRRLGELMITAAQMEAEIALLRQRAETAEGSLADAMKER